MDMCGMIVGLVWPVASTSRSGLTSTGGIQMATSGNEIDEIDWRSSGSGDEGWNGGKWMVM